MPGKSIRYAVPFGALLMAGVAHAGSAPYGECRAGTWTGNRNLDGSMTVQQLACSSEWKTAPFENVRLNFGGHFAYADQGEAKAASGGLRVANIELEAGKWTLRAGRQIFDWGRADRINPTDSLGRKDYTLLVPEEDEQRLGIDALMAQYHFSEQAVLTLVLAPKFAASITPQGSLPPNRIDPGSPRAPEYGLKFDRYGEKFDWSLSWYQGYERLPSWQASVDSIGALVFAGAFDRSRKLGADFAMPAGGWNLHGEAALSALLTNCAVCQPVDGHAFKLVLGADRNFAGSANLNLQVYVVRRSQFVGVAGLPAPQQQLADALNRLNSVFAPQEAGLTMMLTDRFLNDRLKLELGAAYDATNHSGLLRPRGVFALRDRLKLLWGADFYSGGMQSTFGSKRANNLAFVQIGFVY